MAHIVGVRFKEAGKVYYFDPAGFKIAKGELAVVETAHGIECGECMIANSEIPDSEVVKPLKKVLRLATPEDVKKHEEKLKKQITAFEICSEKIVKHGLDMKLVEVEYSFDGSKIIFYFTSDGRVDFRELVKDLASVFRTRIELRQIGVRDEAKMLGGLGICGREFCCSGFLSDFQPVSIKMAKEQGLSLNPVKISGTCGRLMCCLKYEQDAYEYLAKMTPRVGSVVRSEDGLQGVVTEVNLISGNVRVKPDSAADAAPVTVHRDKLTVLRQRGQRNDLPEPDEGETEPQTAVQPERKEQPRRELSEPEAAPSNDAATDDADKPRQNQRRDRRRRRGPRGDGGARPQNKPENKD